MPQNIKNSNMLQYIEDEIKINIFTWVQSSLNLALTCRSWSAIAKDPYAKTEWLIANFGKPHALFHAVRLGPTFLDKPVCLALFQRRVIFSRYFIQKLLMHFGKCDQKLIGLKRQYNARLSAAELIFHQKPWASDLHPLVYICLLEEGCRQLGEERPCGNDMDLFLSIVDNAPEMHLNNIEDLILNKRFIPFPPRPKSLQLDLNSDEDEYPSKDGYENNRQLNVIARAILIHPDLVKFWKRIEYDICNDVNNLVMQGALLNLFLPTPPSVDTVISRLSELINIGFSLDDNVIIDALHVFEHRLNEIGNILWDSFLTIRGEPMPRLALKLFREVFKSERNLKNDDLINFLKSKFEPHKIPIENVMKGVVKRCFMEGKINDITSRRKSPILSPVVYQHILANNFNLATTSFEDILVLRILIDSEGSVPGMPTCTYDWVITIFNLYVKEKVGFKPKYLNLLQKATNKEIINPIFDYHLPSVFGMNNAFRGSNPNNHKKQQLIDRFLIKLREINKEELSISFRECLVNFRQRLEEETIYRF